MSLYEGEKLAGTDFTKRVHKKNFERLKIWQTVGCDSDNGLWAIYGAREGCYLTNCTDWDFVNVRDFEYLNKMWKDKYSKITKEMLPYEIIGLGETLNHELNIDIPVDPYTPAHSKFFKSMYVPPVRVVQDFDFSIKEGQDISIIHIAHIFLYSSTCLTGPYRLALGGQLCSKQ